MCLQAVCYSLINNAIQSEVLQIREGCSPGDLGPTVSWFSKSVSVSVSEDTIKQVNPAQSSLRHAGVKSGPSSVPACVDVQQKPF